jgi:hypothetical protein
MSRIVFGQNGIMAMAERKRENLPVSAIVPLDKKGYKNSIDEIYADTYKYLSSANDGPEQRRSIWLKQDIERLTRGMNAVILGIFPAELHYINRVILPAEFTDDQIFRSKTIEFIASLPTRNPELGINRAIQMVERQQETRLSRYGTHFVMALDYENQKEGKISAALYMRYIAGQYSRNLAHMGMEALAERDYEAEIRAMRQITRRVDYERKMLSDRDNFALPYKEVNGLHIYIAEHAKLMRKRNENQPPTSAIFPVDKKIMILYNDNYTSYDKAGPDGPDRLWKGVLDNPIAGVTLVEAPELPDPTATYDQLSNFVRIGNFLEFKRYEDQKQGVLPSWKAYDAYKDDYVVISPKALIDNLMDHGVFAQDAAGYYVNYAKIIERGQKFGQDRSEYMFFDEDGNAKYATPGTDPENPKNCDHWSEKALADTFDFLGIRPLEGLHMQNVILTLDGEQTGRSVMSYPNLTEGDDAANQSKLVNYTGNYGIVIANPRRIENCLNAFYNGMEGGANLDMVTSDQLRGFLAAGFELDDNSTPCMFIVAIPKGSLRDGPMLDIRGKSDLMSEDNGEMYPHSLAWSRLYGWDQAHSYYMNSRSNNFSRRNIATTVFRAGIHYMGENNQMIERKGKTHHGPYEFPGCQKVREKGLNNYTKLVR